LGGFVQQAGGDTEKKKLKPPPVKAWGRQRLLRGKNSLTSGLSWASGEKDVRLVIHLSEREKGVNGEKFPNAVKKTTSNNFVKVTKNVNAIWYRKRDLVKPI